MLGVENNTKVSWGKSVFGVTATMYKNTEILKGRDGNIVITFSLHSSSYDKVIWQRFVKQTVNCQNFYFTMTFQLAQRVGEFFFKNRYYRHFL